MLFVDRIELNGPHAGECVRNTLSAARQPATTVDRARKGRKNRPIFRLLTIFLILSPLFVLRGEKIDWIISGRFACLGDNSFCAHSLRAPLWPTFDSISDFLRSLTMLFGPEEEEASGERRPRRYYKCLNEKRFIVMPKINCVEIFEN